MQMKGHVTAQLLQESGESDGVGGCVDQAKGRKTHQKKGDKQQQEIRSASQLVAAFRGMDECEVGGSTKRRAAMLESSRDEVRAAEALLQIYDYFLTASEQLARTECHDDISISQTKSEGAGSEQAERAYGPRDDIADNERGKGRHVDREADRARGAEVRHTAKAKVEPLPQISGDTHRLLAQRDAVHEQSAEVQADRRSALKSIEEGRECVVCWSRKSEIALIPCGHVCLCSSCPPLSVCPMCRAEVKSSLRVYLP